LLHNQGRYFEASDLLLGAYESDNRLLPAIRWLQSSYRLGGFEEISASIDNFLKTARENPRSLTDAINHPKSINGAAGVALLGLTMDAHSPGDLKGPLTMALIDALHAATDQPVLLCEDIAQLRAEYDVLTGLENVQGTTWREAPALLLARSITAHLESGKDGGWQLRLCAIRELDPGRIEDQVVNLPNESADWKIKITDALRKLLGEDTGLAAAWKPPAAVIAENEEKLSIALKSQYDDPTLLKLLHVNPDQFDLLWKFPKNRSGVSPLANALRAGMQDWIWMHLPKTSIQRPWIDLQFIEARHGQKLDEFIPLLREFVNKNQRNPAGAVAKFNLLLYDLNEDNIASTEKGIDEVLPVFRHMPEKQFTPQRIQMVEQMRDLLRCAMGQPVANALDLKPCGTIHHPQVFLPDPWLAPMPQHLTVIKKMKDWFEDDSLQAERCKVDVAFYHSVLHREEIPVGLMKQIIEEHAKEPALLTYIMVGYGHDFFDRKEFQQGEIADAATIYSRFVDAITGILSIKLEGPDFKASLRAGFDVALIIDLRASTQELLRNQPVFREARARLSRAIVQAIINERFRDWGNGGNCMLLLDRSGAFSDPECDRFLRERAEQSWKTDPTRDSFWSDYMGWHWRSFAPGERTAEFLKHLPELEALRAKNPWSLRMTELYFQFAEGFYTDSKYEQAKDVLEAIAASKSETVTIPEPEIRAHAFYLLSMLRQRDGDTPGALRIAQAALDEMRDDKFREAGLPLKSEITGYIGKLRADPNLPFKNPYAAAATPVPEKTPATTPGQPTTTP